MGKLSRGAMVLNTALNLQEMERQVAAVENSKLPEEEKIKALKAHKRMVITAFAIVIGTLLLVGVACGIICKLVEGQIRIILCLVTVITGIIVLIVFAICLRKLFPDWTKTYEKVDYGFDGLTEDVVDRLKPVDDEKNVIKYWHRQSAKWAILFLIELAIVITLIVKFEILRTPYITIAFIIITGFWYIKEDECQVEIRRIKSGYYKTGFGFICQKCKKEVFIKFSEAEMYESLPRDKSNIRIMHCLYCDNEIPLYHFDSEVKHYKEHRERVEELRK